MARHDKEHGGSGMAYARFAVMIATSTVVIPITTICFWSKPVAKPLPEPPVFSSSPRRRRPQIFLTVNSHTSNMSTRGSNPFSPVRNIILKSGVSPWRNASSDNPIP